MDVIKSVHYCCALFKLYISSVKGIWTHWRKFWRFNMKGKFLLTSPCLCSSKNNFSIHPFTVLFVLAISFAAVAALPVYPIKIYPDHRCPRFDSPHILVMLPHLSDCSKFITCVSGLGFEMRCPDGLEFSPIDKICNYPHLAQCRQDQAVPYEPIDPIVSRTTLSKFYLTRAAFEPSEHTTLAPVTVAEPKFWVVEIHVRSNYFLNYGYGKMFVMRNRGSTYR